MKLSEYMKKYEINPYALADQLQICKGYLINISSELARPSKRLARLIEVETNGEVKAVELLGTEPPIRYKCPYCGSLCRKKIVL